MSSMVRAIMVLAGMAILGILTRLPISADARGDQPVAQAPVRQGRPIIMRAPQAAQVLPDGEPAREGEFSDGALTLPTNPKAKKSLDAAEDFIKEEAWAEATHVLQALLDLKEDAFVKKQGQGADGKEIALWVSVWEESNRLIGDMPANGLEVYELQYGARARERLEEARKAPAMRSTDDLKNMPTPKILADIVRRYRHTKAGAEAAVLQGTYFFDRGEPLQAALYFDQLHNRQKSAGAHFTPTPLTLLKAILAYRQLGEKDNADQMWQKLAKLSPGGVRVGDRAYALNELRRELDKVPSQAVARAASDWPMHQGNPSRSAQGKGGTPFLDEDVNKWVQPTIRHIQTKQWVEQAIAAQENRQQTATLPAFFPIAAAGKLVYRSYFGVHAVDLATGKLKWELDSDWSMDRMAADPSKMAQLNQWIPMYQQSGSQSILFENSTLGSLSTDNHFVFCVEDLALPPHPSFLAQFMWGGRPTFGPMEDPMQHNKLRAIDLETGKRKWEMGGHGDKDELSDSFFLGPPLPLSGKLYVLTEKNSEMRLVCLDAGTGAVQWIQTLASVRDPIVRDVGRRIQAVHLAYSDGILVCPTHAGTILGVDLLTHGLLWARNYREGIPASEPAVPIQRRGMPMHFGQSLTPDWKCSAPIVQGGKVVFTAPDGSGIHCLNLRDGARVWKASRAEDLYLGGVLNGKVILVGKNSCRALSLADGKQLWNVETGLPSGYGIASDSVYYLPLKTSAHDKDKGPEVCAIDIDAGRIVAHSKTRKKELPGNLLFYEGKVVSQTVFNLTAYPQLKVKLAEMNARIDKNPKDPIGLTERAELQRNEGEVARAVDDLRTALANEPDAVIRPKARQLLFECLTELFQKDFNASEKYLEEYKEMCRVAIPNDATPEESKRLKDEAQRRQANYLCLVAKGREQQGKLLDAFRSYVEFGNLGDKTLLLTVLDEPSVKARSDVWAQGRIAAMVAKAGPEQRKLLEDEIARQWRDLAGSRDVQSLRNFVALFGSIFSAGKEARLQLAERLLEDNAAGDAFLEAELQLLQVRREEEGQPASRFSARAIDLLARLMTRKGLLEDAAYWYRMLARDFGQTVIRDGKTGTDILNDLATDKRFLPFLDEPPSWSDGRVKAREETGQFQQVHQVFYFEPEGDVQPFFKRHQLAFNMNLFQVKLIDRMSNEERWSHQLTRQQQNNLQYLHANQQHTNVPSLRYSYHVQGHTVVFNLGLMVYGFDLANQKVLWEKNLFGNDVLPLQQIIANPLGGLNAMYPDGRVEKIGQTGPFEPGFLCLQMRQGLAAFDPIRGDVLWTKTDVPAWAQLFGDTQHLYLIDVRSNGTIGTGRALRARDGVAVDVPDFSALYPRKIGVLGRCLLLAEQNVRGNGLNLRLYDAHTGQDLWKKEFSKDAVVLRSDDPELVGVAEPNNGGKLTLLNPRTQQELLQGAMDPKDLDKAQTVHLLQDRNLFYVVVNGPANPQLNPWGGPWPNLMNGMRGIMTNGKLHAFERSTGKVRWKSDVPNQMLILEQYKDLPVLLFTSRSQQMVNGGVQQVTRTKSIEKRTGKLIYDKEAFNAGTQFHSLQTDMKAGTIDLVSYNLKIRHYVER